MPVEPRLYGAGRRRYHRGGHGRIDDSVRLASESGARVFHMPTRSGPAHARNVGAQQARGDILLFVDADVTVRPDTIGGIDHAPGYRLRRAGDRILLPKALQVKHLKPRIPPSLLRSDFAQRALPWAERILRRGRFDNDLL